MQSQMQMQRQGQQGQASRRSLLRAIRYLGNHRRSTLMAYGALLIATLAQLAVPQLTENMIDAITSGVRADAILNLPEAAQNAAARQIGMSLDQLHLDSVDAESLLINAALFIVAFAVMRG
ncbi:MAG TPA: hypothetical protein VJZ27_10490, partial [Aggregatilineales bacterium]|nr:hypothetical protein [Aggregatilineales bacterium]